MIVSAPCRLHFGLFHVPVPGLQVWPDGTPIRKFGGLGMMIRNKRVIVEAVPNDQLTATGPLAERSLDLARRLPGAPPVILNTSGPPEHTGLGVGTSLAMCVGTALGWDSQSDHLPRLLGRGNRSGIGIEGFRHGGFIVDDGKIGDDLPTIRERIAVPVSWHIVIIRPSDSGQWHGHRERSAFGRNRSPNEALETTQRLRQLADNIVIPALRSADFDTFARGITLFNRIAGEPFAADQGGPYASAAVEGLVEQLSNWGVCGVGQSSWGPTVFAFAPDRDEAEWLQNRVKRESPVNEPPLVTPSDLHGAVLSCEQDSSGPDRTHIGEQNQ